MQVCDLHGLPVRPAGLSGFPVRVNLVRNAESVDKKLTLLTTTEIMSEYPLVLISWADAHAGHGGWLSLSDYEDDGECLVNSVGFLVPPGEGGKKDHVTLWQTISDGEGIHPFHIPVSMVRNTKLLSGT